MLRDCLGRQGEEGWEGRLQLLTEADVGVISKL